MLMWSREKKTHYIEKNKDKIKADFLSGAMQAIRLSNDMFKEPKKKLSTRFFFSIPRKKITLKMEKKIKTFSEKSWENYLPADLEP